MHLLHKDDIGALHVVDNVSSNGRQVGRGRGQVLDVVRAKGYAVAPALGLDFGWVGQCRLLGICDLDGCRGQDAVEAESVRDDTGNLSEVVADARVGGVLGAVEGGTDCDGLWVCIYQLSVDFEILYKSSSSTHPCQSWLAHRGRCGP